MASNLFVSGVDLDTLLKPRGAASPISDTHIKVAGTDIAQRYKGSGIVGDRLAYNTNIRSGGVDITDLFMRDAYVEGPVITSQPTAATRNVGASMTLTTSATGTGTLLYQWRRDVGGGYVDAPGTSTNASYTIASLVSGDEGSYKCVVTDDVGFTDTNIVFETVNFLPSVDDQPDNGTLNIGNTASFTITIIEGKPTPATYQWERLIPGGSWSDVTSSTESSRFSGTTGLSVSFSALAGDHDSQFRCKVTNSVGTVTSAAATLSVNRPPVLSSSPSSASQNELTTLNLSCSAVGSPTLTYQWRRDIGAGYANAPGTSTNASYSISSLALGDQGDYKCDITNSFGSVTTSVATVTVNQNPYVTTDPVTAAFTWGTGPHAINCVAGGSGTLYFEWFLNNVSQNSPRVGNLSSTSDQVVWNPIYTASGGTWKCKVTNSNGGAYDTSAEATITVNDTAITLNTGSSTMVVGGHNYALNVGDWANLIVVLTTGSNPSYTWYKNAVFDHATIPGTSTEVGAAFTVTVGDQGDVWSVDISNGWGTVTASATI